MARIRDQGLYETKYEHDACGIGAVVNIAGTRDHSILEYGKQILINLTHRGAAGSDETTGDGAGILFQIPHEFFAVECEERGFSLPEPFGYGVGMVFGPKGAELRGGASGCWRSRSPAMASRCSAGGRCPRRATAWANSPWPPSRRSGRSSSRGRDMSRRNSSGGCSWPANGPSGSSVGQFGEKAEDFYVVSLSCRTICYKGMFMAWQLFAYYPDLADERVKSALAIVHQRYSTNTFPNWRLAQPFRCIAHNGEINTLSGNRNRHAGPRAEAGQPSTQWLVPRDPDGWAPDRRGTGH
jgi:glutamate synthase (NADPH) large chain